MNGLWSYLTTFTGIGPFTVWMLIVAVAIALIHTLIDLYNNR